MDILPPVSDEELLNGSCGEIGGLVMVKRDLKRAWIAKKPGSRMDGFYRTDEEQRDWQLAQSELYEGLEYTPTPLAIKRNET